MFYYIFFRAIGFTLFLPFGKSANSFYLRIIFSGSIALTSISLIKDLNLEIAPVIFEVLYGILISLPAVLLIEILSLIGEYFDVGRGLSIGSFYDPFFSANVSLNSKFVRFCVWTLIVFSGGLIVFTKLIIDSYQVLPVINSIKDLNDLLKFLSTFKGVYIILSNLFMSAFVWSLPFLSIFLIIDFFIAFFGKIVPQLQLQQESFILKSVIAYLILFLLSETNFIYFLNSFFRYYPKLFSIT